MGLSCTLAQRQPSAVPARSRHAATAFRSGHAAGLGAHPHAKPWQVGRALTGLLQRSPRGL